VGGYRPTRNKADSKRPKTCFYDAGVKRVQQLVKAN
jgi:hypothetical protein